MRATAWGVDEVASQGVDAALKRDEVERATDGGEDGGVPEDLPAPAAEGLGVVVEPGSQRKWCGATDLTSEERREDDAQDGGLSHLGVAGAQEVEVPDALEALEDQFDLPAAAVERQDIGAWPGGVVEGGDQEHEASRDEGAAVDGPALLLSRLPTPVSGQVGLLLRERRATAGR